ncbi:hypothetical protein SAMN02745152_02090 [Treponema berlinense]|uniref:Uncharacterized protein n=1 Tax=Treponema berlinense TaxID=225004 RepID=A0A1T4QSN1_9SPIR|nr:hypothetical protein [Treponema berlinense]MCR4952465.1 hypothetical protein [Treponema sp.]SKA06607.1 hypothetical protein SAMN02745152_02090 [Treponema berlinense]
MKTLTSVVMPNPTGRLDSMILTPVLEGISTCIQILNQGTTERELIRARRDTLCTMLQEKRDLMVEYLTKRYGERNKLYDGYFDLINKALESGNDAVIKLALESLLQVYSSPFASGLDNIMEQYGKMNSVLEQ